jgi:pimeloyl-ACP methyl ester carboxylesterase
MKMLITKLSRAVAAALVVTLLTTSCAVAATKLPNTVALKPNVEASIATDLKPIYSQKITFTKCGADRTYCGTVLVPMNWAKPSGKKLKLAVAYRQADIAKPKGFVFFNPGGPGTSGLDFSLNSISSIGTPALRKNFNVVGFDPRGVGQSEPKVKCLTAARMDHFLYGIPQFELGSAGDLAETRATMKEFADACVANTGAALGYIDTVSAARDLDVLRAVFGQSKFNYLGYSYGTYLGTMYAQLYPKRVGRMVLDGAINPLMSDEDQSLAQLKGFDLAFRNYLTQCLSSSDCPFSGSLASAQQAMANLFLKIEANPLPTASGRKVSYGTALTGLIMALYSNSSWSTLSYAITEAKTGKGDTLLELADAYNDRKANGTYSSNITEANISINCLDARQSSSPATMAAQNARVVKASVVFGRYWQFGGLGCAEWPYPLAKHPTNYKAAGAPTIIVVGTTGDPATPYSQAVDLANSVLKKGQLITFNGDGHTAYGHSNTCVDDHVDDFFLNGVVPSEDPKC